jgi:hypothetical protein
MLLCQSHQIPLTLAELDNISLIIDLSLAVHTIAQSHLPGREDSTHNSPQRWTYGTA